MDFPRPETEGKVRLGKWQLAMYWMIRARYEMGGVQQCDVQSLLSQYKHKTVFYVSKQEALKKMEKCGIIKSVIDAGASRMREGYVPSDVYHPIIAQRINRTMGMFMVRANTGYPGVWIDKRTKVERKKDGREKNKRERSVDLPVL